MIEVNAIIAFRNGIVVEDVFIMLRRIQKRC